MNTTSNDILKILKQPLPETERELNGLSPQLNEFLNELAKMAALRQVLKELLEESEQKDNP
jgi:hypothetical protein